MTKREQQDKWVLYYNKCLLHYLGLEKDIYTTKTTNVYVFYHYPFGRMKLFVKANKIQQAKNGKWITDAADFIIRIVLKDKTCPTYNEYYRLTLF